MNELERDNWRLRALVVAEVVGTVVVVAALVWGAWSGLQAAERHDVPWWALVVGLAFPAGALARLLVQAPQIAAVVRSWHEAIVQRLEAS